MNDRSPVSDWLETEFRGAYPALIGVGVSGGGDSMALLDGLASARAAFGFHLAAVTVDHGLREEAKDEIALVARFCAERAIPHTVLRWKWNGAGNLQAAARAARYSLIADWAKANGIAHVALGHTLDDVAETFLMRLSRKSGVEGLSHMADIFRRDGVTWMRPLLGIGRDALRAQLTAAGVRWAEDASNGDEAFERVRARKVLAALAPLGVRSRDLADVAFHMEQANTALDAYLVAEVSAHAAIHQGDLILPTCAPRNGGHVIPDDILHRMRRAALQWVGGGAYPPRSEAVSELDTNLAVDGKGTLHGCLVTQTVWSGDAQEQWRITREYNAVKELVGSTDAVWDGRWVLEGPHEAGLHVRALGEEGLRQLPMDWRDSGMPRASLLSGPSVWRGATLISAPIAGYFNGWQAKLTNPRDDFAAWLIRR